MQRPGAGMPLSAHAPTRIQWTIPPRQPANDAPSASCPSPAAQDRALCVDLDGTLLDTDLLYESLLVLLARNPLYLFLLPFWLLQARPH